MVILYFYYIYLPSLILLYSDICIVCVGFVGWFILVLVGLETEFGSE